VKPNFIRETQFHSFHGFDECPDEVDWLRIDNSNGEIGSYVVEVNSVDGFTNAVDMVNIYNTDANGNRAAKFSEITSGNGSIQIPCNTSTNDFLIEVVKAEDTEDEIVQSIYTISLSADQAITLSNMDKSVLCTFDQFEILNLPLGATVTWSSSFSITHQVNSDQSITIENVSNTSSFYQIIADINYNGCQKRISKTFESANGNNLQPFVIVEASPACFPPATPSSHGRFYTIPSTVVNWNNDSFSIFGPTTGKEVSVNAAFGDFTLTATYSNGCGNEYTTSETFFADNCDSNPFGLKISNINEETIEVEVVNQSDNFRNNGIHQVVVTDINYDIKEQFETEANICIINTANYDDGIFVVHAYVEDDYAVEKIFVNKVNNCSSNCPCYANISDAQLSSKTFRIEQNIISNSFNNANVTYIAGESILLETGFETHTYFDFEAKIEDCQ